MDSQGKMQIAKKHCRQCGEVIHGRRDKQFCSDHCRATHYNVHHTDITVYIREINKIIRRNRSILFNLKSKGNKTIQKTQLIQSGYNFDYQTSFLTTASGQVYIYCYDMGYVEMQEGNTILILNRKSTKGERYIDNNRIIQQRVQQSLPRK